MRERAARAGRTSASLVEATWNVAQCGSWSQPYPPYLSPRLDSLALLPLDVDSADAPLPGDSRTSRFSNPPTVRSGPARPLDPTVMNPALSVLSTLIPLARQLLSSGVPFSATLRPPRRNEAERE